MVAVNVAAAVEVECYDAGRTFVVGSIQVHGLAPVVLCSRRVIGSVHPHKKVVAPVRKSEYWRKYITPNREMQTTFSLFFLSIRRIFPFFWRSLRDNQITVLGGA